MDVTYTIVKGYVTERYDVIKGHSNAITIWQTSAINVTALLKTLRSEKKGVQEKESIMGAKPRQKNPSLVVTVWHHSASLDSDPREGYFYLHLTPMIDP